jgi:hypothetical protein
MTITEKGHSMNSPDSAKPPVPAWFWATAVLAVLWNGIGVYQYLVQVTATEASLQALPLAHQEFYDAIPVWATSGFAVAVFGALAGSVLLLLRNRFAELMFVISLIGLFLQDIHAFVMGHGIEVFGAGAIGLPATVLAIGVALFFFARVGTARGWLR